MVRLIVAEKPSVARDLARVLKIRRREDGVFRGDKIWVTWCLGHMAELCEPAEYDPVWKSWSAGTLPIIPDTFKVRPIERTANHWRVLKKLFRDKQVEEVINACDAGREGELIFRYAAEMAGCKKPVRRLWLSSMTDKAIQTAFRNLRPGADFDTLGDAARCRSEADWLVGINATRALTVLGRRATGGGGLFSVGRVQTPTLAMIVVREDEIESFVPEPFFQIYATFKVEHGTYEGLWTKGRNNRLPKREEAEAVAAQVDGETGAITRVEQKKLRERPQRLHDLTQLQRLANQRYGMSAAGTLAATQALYEKHKLLTYPRTDSNFLTEDMVPTLPGRLRGISSGPYAAFCQNLLGSLPLPTNKRFINDKEVGDHHAIIPTGREPNLDSLSEPERRIFDLVARRFIAIFYPDAVFATTRIETTVGDHLFTTRGRVRLEAGWQEVEPPSKKKKPSRGKAADSGKGKAPEQDLPKVTKGEDAVAQKVRVHEGSTKPPRRFNESALLGAMERAGQALEEAELRRALKECGLGTPATRASTIETLIKRDFIHRQGKNLVPTPRGRALIGAMPVDALKSPQLTGDWEARLTQVADGRLSRKKFMDEARAFTARVVPDILQANTEDIARAVGPGAVDILGVCPVCNSPVTEKPKTYSCGSGRDCTFVIFKTMSKRKITLELAKTLLETGRSEPLTFESKAGKPFEASIVLDKEGKATFDFNDAPSPPPDPVPCPACEQGRIIRGRRGWGCSRWRDGCRFVLWFENFGRSMTNDEARELLSTGRTGQIVLDLNVDGYVRRESP